MTTGRTLNRLPTQRKVRVELVNAFFDGSPRPKQGDVVRVGPARNVGLRIARAHGDKGVVDGGVRVGEGRGRGAIRRRFEISHAPHPKVVAEALDMRAPHTLPTCWCDNAW